MVKLISANSEIGKAITEQVLANGKQQFILISRHLSDYCHLATHQAQKLSTTTNG